jgi:hypothetical protein
LGLILFAGQKEKREAVGALEDLDPFSIEDAKAALAKRKVQKKERRIFDTLLDSNKTFNELTDWLLMEKEKQGDTKRKR